jgi:hypothetical protein
VSSNQSKKLKTLQALGLLHYNIMEHEQKYENTVRHELITNKSMRLFNNFHTKRKNLLAAKQAIESVLQKYNRLPRPSHWSPNNNNSVSEEGYGSAPVSRRASNVSSSGVSLSRTPSGASSTVYGFGITKPNNLNSWSPNETEIEYENETSRV